MGIRLLVCGGRDFSNMALAKHVLNKINERYRVDVVIHGAAKGADSCAAYWADDERKIEFRFPANWALHGKRAGFLRNEEMISIGQPNMVVCFPGGAGTAHMKNTALKYPHIHVIEVVASDAAKPEIVTHHHAIYPISTVIPQGTLVKTPPVKKSPRIIRRVTKAG